MVITYRNLNSSKLYRFQSQWYFKVSWINMKRYHSYCLHHFACTRNLPCIFLCKTFAWDFRSESMPDGNPMSQKFMAVKILRCNGSRVTFVGRRRTDLRASQCHPWHLVRKVNGEINFQMRPTKERGNVLQQRWYVRRRSFVPRFIRQNIQSFYLM